MSFYDDFHNFSILIFQFCAFTQLIKFSMRFTLNWLEMCMISPLCRVRAFDFDSNLTSLVSSFLLFHISSVSIRLEIFIESESHASTIFVHSFPDSSQHTALSLHKRFLLCCNFHFRLKNIWKNLLSANFLCYRFRLKEIFRITAHFYS